MIKNLKIQQKFMLTLFAVVFISLSLVIGATFLTANKALNEGSLKIADQTAQISSAAVSEMLSNSMYLAKSIGVGLEGLHSSGVRDRDTYNNVIHKVLEANPSILAAWTAWEPNALDGKDTEFANSAGHDDTGRFVPYWVRSGGEIVVEPLMSYDVPGDGDYYLVPFQSEKAVILDPYLYPVNGVETLITSLVLPIRVNGKVVGVAGVDIAMSDVQNVLSEVKPFGVGYVSLISESGVVVSHPTDGSPGKNAADIGLVIPDTNSLAQNSRVLKTGINDAVLGEDTLRLYQTLEIALTESAWVLAISAPESIAFAAERNAMMVQLGILIVALFGAVLVAWLAGNNISKPILNMTSSMRKLADGELAVTIPALGQTNEIGNMADALQVFKNAAMEKIQLEKDASDERQQTEEERANNERQKDAETQKVQIAVNEIGRGLQQLADGDLSANIGNNFAPELDGLRVSFNESVYKIRSTLSQILDGAKSIDNNSQEMGNAADELSRRTEKQAASLEETSAALEEITSTVQETSTRATEAAEVANQAKHDTDKSGTVVRNAVIAMEGIEKASSEINNIINVIDEIAFQTNLLALNAGVEAARAGDAGKGFAVVAQEVRELAQRAAGAAKEIKDLISKSGDEVAKGVDLVKATGESLNQISEHVTNINGKIGTIATAATEQLTGVKEVNTAVSQMDMVTQQNAAMVEESTAVTHRMTEDVITLNKMLSEFKFSQTTNVDTSSDDAIDDKLIA
jgi:methyl-accepting chemotaxis protein/methyl-accepting chemotaxis protein-1 (serine sensor receptor)